MAYHRNHIGRAASHRQHSAREMPEQQNSSTSIALSHPLVVRSEIIRQEHILNICVCVCMSECMYYFTGRNGV
jgi:hypothetical protein